MTYRTDGLAGETCTLGQLTSAEVGPSRARSKKGKTGKRV